MTKFEQVANYLTSRYHKEIDVSSDTTYYWDKGGIVAYQKGNLIGMYFSCYPDVIWNHENLVKVAIIKDLRIIEHHYGDIYKEKTADVVIVTGYCGANSAFTVFDNSVVNGVANHRMHGKEKAIGITISRGHFKILDGNIEIKVAECMCDFDFPENLNYSILRSKFKKPRTMRQPHEGPKLLKERYRWNYNEGRNSAGTPEIINAIRKIETQCNYDKLAGATIMFK